MRAAAGAGSRRAYVGPPQDDRDVPGDDPPGEAGETRHGEIRGRPPGSWSPPAPNYDPPMSPNTVDIAGRRLALARSGRGFAPRAPACGFPLSAGMWAPQLGAPPPGWRLIAPDLRGFGATTGPPATSVDDHADDVLALLRHLGIERSGDRRAVDGRLCGVCVVATRAAQRFRALGPWPTPAAMPTPSKARANRVRHAADGSRARRRRGTADAMIPKLLGPAARATDELPNRLRAIFIVANPVSTPSSTRSTR